MMIGGVAKRTIALSETQKLTRDTSSLLAQKIWLPKLLYAVLPYFYLASGIGALVTTMYIGHWAWVLPHYLIFSVACLHMGVLIYLRRKKAKHNSD